MTLEQTQSLSPNPATLDRASHLASPRKWIRVERNDRALWGECSGTGTVYQSIVDMNGPAYKCTCPVKQFPCKHTLALLLMAAEAPDTAFALTEPPAWVTEWIEKRDKKAAAKEVVKTPEQLERSAANKERSQALRLKTMELGVADIKSRLTDIIREGLASLEKAPADFWKDFASRMVDAQLGGLAKRIKALAAFVGKEDNWHEQLLETLSAFYLFAKAFEHIDEIPDDLQDHMLALAGVSIKKEELLSQDGVIDDWLVLGQMEKAEEDNLTSRRVWLTGMTSGKMAMSLDFAFGGASFMNAWIDGQVYRGEMVYYPGTHPVRVVPKAMEPVQEKKKINGYTSFIYFVEDYAKAISANPWIWEWAVILTQITPVFDKGVLWLIDKDKKRLPVKSTPTKTDKTDGIYTVLAISGGYPITVFGDWDGKQFNIISVIGDGKLIKIIQ